MEKDSKNKIICILGMHRSGTSMITRILNICGLYIGEKDELVGAAKGNEKGHWENIEAQAINKDILSLFEIPRSHPYFPDNWENSPELSDLYARAKKFVNEMNSRSLIWGMKDPRLCLTLPFWKKVIPNMYYIIPFRDSMEVANSLKLRNGYKKSYGLVLWSMYWVNIIRHTQNEKRFVTFQKNYIYDWKKELKSVFSFIDDKFLGFEGKEDKINDFIAPSLVHCSSERINSFSQKADSLNFSDQELLDSFFNELNYAISKIYEDERNNQKESDKRIDKLIKEIEKMKSSKFWKIREYYLKFKDSFRF